MGVFKEILHSLAGIWADVKVIKQMQDPTLLAKAKRYDEVSKYLSDIRLRVAKVYTKLDDEGAPLVCVEYAKEVRHIRIDRNGGDVCDPFIVAANNLNLIPVEDMMRIKEEIEKNIES